ncbi:MAG: hypothetical protein JWQ21_573 [Herminiimonas sp.]|jgi:hypothetical protein|nr:hypothetical protein [Herminiimonas sp.]
MALERLGRYEIDVSAIQLADTGQWLPYLEIFSVPGKPEKIKNVFPKQRVSGDAVFAAATAAKLEARRIAISMIGWGRFEPCHVS